MSVVIAGSIALDDITTVKGSVTGIPGGSALYCAVAASLYSEVFLVSIAGDDFPADVIDFLGKRRVNTDNLTIVPDGKTFHWGTCYEPDMHNRTPVRRDLNVSVDFNPRLTAEAAQARCVFLANLEPENQIRVLDQAENPRFVALDTMKCYIKSDPGGLKSVIQRVDILFINDAEARQLADCNDTLTAAHILSEMGPDYVIVKKGEHGSFACADGVFFTIPAYPLDDVTDPTGAGDSYAGAAMGFLAGHHTVTPDTVKSAMVHGTVVASFCVEDFGIESMRNITPADIRIRKDHLRSITSF
ncbi:PfkB family carbohydrate kinase [Candidatus Latescibacterota bacterium]